MPNTGQYGRPGNGGSGWLILGVIATLGMGAMFLAVMAGQMRSFGPGPLVVVAMLGAGMFGAVALGPIGKAIGKRILDGAADPATDGLVDEVNELRVQSEDMRQALAETQERLDFTERMLSGGRERTPEELH